MQRQPRKAIMRSGDHDRDADLIDERQARHEPEARADEAIAPLEGSSGTRRAELDPEPWDTDRVVRLAGEAILSDPDHPIWEHEQFLEWLARDLRDRKPRERSMSDEELAARGEWLQLRVKARQLQMWRREGRAPWRVASVPARPQEAIALAAQEEAAPLVDLSVAAGAGRELWDEPVEQWVVLPDEIPGGKYLAVRIRGDSMEPIMHTGDVVLVKLGDPVKAGTVVVARQEDDGYVCKKVRRVRRDRLELESLRKGLPVLQLARHPDPVVGTVVLVWCEHSQRVMDTRA